MALKWNSADAATFALTDNKLTATSTAAINACRATLGRNTGKWYYTVKINIVNIMIGLSRSIATTYSLTSGFCVYGANGKKFGSTANWNNATYSTAFAVNDIIDIVVDLDTLSVTYYKNSASLGAFTFSLSGSGLIYPTLFGPGAVGSTTIVLSTGKFSGYTWWDPTSDFTPRRTTDILNYGITKSIFR